MLRVNEIEAQQRDLRKRLKIMEQINQLEREKQRLKDPQQLVDLTHDEYDDDKVKIEQSEGEGADFSENEGREAAQNYGGGREMSTADREFDGMDEARPQNRSERSRPGMAAASHRERHVEGPPNPAGRSHHQNSAIRGATSFSSPRGPPAAPQQSHINGLPPPTGVSPFATFGQRFNGIPVQQWQRDVPDHDSTYGSGQWSPPEEREPATSHQNAAVRLSFLHNWNRSDDRRPLFGRDPPYGQAQPNQAARSHGDHAPQGTQAERLGMMGQPLGMVDNRGPAQTRTTASPTVALEGYAYDKHSIYPTLVSKPDGSGFWELRCYVCGANVTRNGGKAQKGKPQGGQFFAGVAGFQNHIRICHPAELGETGKNLSTATMIERCKVRELSHDDINAMRSKHRGAYKIDRVVGASADANSAVRKPHWWKTKKRTEPLDQVNEKPVRKRRKVKPKATPQPAQGLGDESGPVTTRSKGKQRRAPTPAEVGGDEDDFDELQESEEEPRRRLTRGRNRGNVPSLEASAQKVDDFLGRFDDLAAMGIDPAGMEQDIDTPEGDEALAGLGRQVGMEEVTDEEYRDGD